LLSVNPQESESPALSLVLGSCKNARKPCSGEVVESKNLTLAAGFELSIYQKFAMKTAIFLKMVKVKKVYNNFSFPTLPIKAEQIFVLIVNTLKMNVIKWRENYAAVKW
jgi:hypothetical protein